MNPNESIKDLADRFLHLCYEFSKEDMNWDFFKENFRCLVQISLKQFEFESMVNNALPTFVNQGTTPISQEEPTFFCLSLISSLFIS